MAAVVVPARSPQWVSHRRLLEQKLADLNCCSDLRQLQQLHAQVYRHCLHRDDFVVPKLVASYALLCRQVPSAVAAFRQVPLPNAHLYNTLIRAFAANAQHSRAFSAFLEMQKGGVFPDNFTYSFLLKACSGTSAFSRVKMIHSHVVKFGFFYDVFVPNALIDSYSKAGHAGLVTARKVFDIMPHRDVVSWNSIISGSIRAGELTEARLLFHEMPERDIISWNTMLDGYSKTGEMAEAFRLLQEMPERNVVSWSTVISGYCKVGDMDMANMLFDKMPTRNLVTWTIMVTGYAGKGMAKEASTLFYQMIEAGFEPDIAAIVSILAACAESGLLGLGKKIHGYVQENKSRLTTQVSNALIDMYSKCGCLDMSWTIFEEMVEKDLVSWNSMVQGLAMHGYGKKALDLFARMKREGVKPDAVTFIGVLCACTHSGLVDDARHYFYSMERDYGIVPQIEHYGCFIDILGRGGLLAEAFELVNSMPVEPNEIIWGTLLGACRVHNDVNLAEEAIHQLIRLEPSDAGNYAILSNIYAAAGCWDGVAKVRIQMKNTGQQKPAGSSWIELNDTVHDFTVGARTHSEAKKIMKMLDRLGWHLKQVGYVPMVCTEHIS